MNCRTFQKQLEDYLGDRFDFSGCFAMERHAGQCVHCGRELTAAKELGRMARKLDRVKAPPDFESSVLDEIAARKLHRRFSGFQRFPVFCFDISWRKYALAISCFIVLGLGFFYWNVPDAIHSPQFGELTPDIQSGPFDIEVSEEGLSVRFQTNESDYSEYTAIGPDDLPMIVPLPNTIRMQVGLPSEEFFITNISH